MKALAKLKDDARKHEQREEWDKAIAVYVEVLRTAEKGEVEQELPLFNRVGDLYVRLGKPAEAVKYYERAADHYAEAGLYNNAIALCNKALRYMPDRTELLKKLGQFSALQGFGTDARRWYLEYAEKMLQRGALDEAFSALEDFANLSEDAEIRELLGRQLRTHGRGEQAVMELKRAHSLRLEAGQTVEAERLKKEILALDPNAFSAAAAAPPVPEPAVPGPAPSAELPGLIDLGIESAAGAAFGARPGDLDASLMDLPDFDSPVKEDLSDEVSTDLPMLDLSIAEPTPVPGLDISGVEIDTPLPAGVDTSDLGLERADFSVDEELADRIGDDLPLIEDDTSFGAAPLPGFDEATRADVGYVEDWEDYDSPLSGLDELPMLDTVDALPMLDTVDDLPMLDTADASMLDYAPEDELPPRAELFSPLDSDLPSLDGELSGFEENLLPMLEGPGVLGTDDLIEADADPAGLSDALFDLPIGEIPVTPDHASDAAVPPIALRGAVPEPAAQNADDSDDNDYELPSIWDDDEESAVDLEWEPPAATIDQPPENAPFDFALPETFEIESADTPVSDVILPSYEVLEHELTPEPEPVVFAQPETVAQPDDGARDTRDIDWLDEVSQPQYDVVSNTREIDWFDETAAPAYDELATGVPADFGPMDADVRPDEVEDPAPEALGEAVHSAAGDLVPDAVADIVPDAGFEVAPDVVPDAGFEAAPDVVRDASPDVRPEDAPDVVPDESMWAAVRAPASPPAPPQPPTHESVARNDYVDLASFLTEEEEPAQPTTRFVVAEQPPTGDEERDFADMLAQFKQKVAEHVSFDDAASHYDLGLAYKEMGLVDEAISEFQTALKGGLERLKVFEELGHCFLLKEQYNIAATVLNRALQLPVDDDMDLIGVYYHLARAYEALGQNANARSTFERVVGLDIGFQDAAERLARL